MLTLGSLAFATPWVLIGLVVLPLIWLLLRVTPPAPRLQRFPAIRLLFGLRQREETPARTPWWLILLRMTLAAAVILGLAHPLLNPGGKLPGAGPLVLVIDDGWAAARVWLARQRDAVDLLDVAERDGRTVVLLTTARQPGGEAPVAIGPQRPAEIRARVQALAPKPWPVDREAARQAVEKLPLSGPGQAVYYADGLDDPAVTGFAQALQQLGSLRVVTAASQDLPILLLPPENRAGEVDIVAKRIAVDQPGLAIVRALAADGRLLARETLTFEPRAGQATVHLKLPIELRNNLARIEIEGQEQTGAVVLFDDRWQRRPVGVVSSTPLEGGQSLLEDTFYMERALGPFAEIRRGTIADLLHSQLAVLLLADDAALADTDRAGLKSFIDNGGVVVRFAGPRLADGKPDDLVPVRLRPGGRELGTALQWTEPAHLAPFRPSSPFAGLGVPGEVTISRQVLAEPALDLPEKSWAQLADGTPLVTADKRGTGWLVLFHVPANAEWSNLPLSGLFVEMLRRVVQLSRGIAGGAGNQPLPPIETLDGFGRLQAAPASATALLPEAAQNGAWRVDPRHPPGFYGSDQLRQAVNLTATVTDIAPLRALPAGVQRGELQTTGEIDLKAWLLTGALALALIDLFVALALRGLLLGRVRRVASIALLGLLLGTGAAQAQAQAPTPPAASAQEPRGESDDFALKATLETRLVYVRTGNSEVDEVSRAGLRGLTTLLNRRTAVEAAEPMAIDVEIDELAFFPLLYWPVVTEQRPLSPAAIERLNTYLHTGGTILFDTRDQGELTADPRSGPGARRLQQLVRGLEIPPLGPVPPDHVLTKAFYLLQDFPGRYAGGALWVESREGTADEVSSVIIGSNDYAGAWAIDNANRPMFAVVPGGERQREFAYRFGVNVVMYALTGNYKTDQVHVPSILERLGNEARAVIENGLTVAFAPLIPWLALIVLGALTLAALGFTLLRRARGVGWRLLAAAALWLTLANPSLINERRELRKDVGVVIVDESASQTIGDRKAQTEAALARLVEQAKQNPDLELRVVRTGADAESFDGDGGTRLFQALDRALSDVPRRRFAGAILITDGQVHDVPKLADGGDASKLATGGSLPPGPIHTLLTGAPGEVDRRLVVVRAPTFGLVDKPVTVTIRVEDSDSRNHDPVPVTLRRDGGAEVPLSVPANQDYQLEVPIQHGGQTIVELSAAPGPRELTTINNNAVVAINGIRDRLRVLLISGEPHAGERTWRNLLKSDPSVDLVHFTILRPPEKQDGTPINELSLIAFPIRELFEVKLHEFDLIIFDRYKRQNIVPRIYIQAIAKYVEDGGAVLEAAGPSFASRLSLFNTPLGEILPGEPTGKVFEQPFKPQLTEVGRRHPVTADLGGGGATPSWGRWFRHIEVTARHGEVVMSGVDNEPLLLLDRVGQGRIAQLASDHIWLWSRGYDGGGPQAELLRRLAHWLMKEPALEEEDLRAEMKDGRIEVTRRSLKTDPVSVTITDPLGEQRAVELTDAGSGRATARVPVTRPGLYRITDGTRTALAAVGSVNPKEFADVRATSAPLTPIATASGGGMFWIGTGGGPDLRRVREDRAAHGRDWLALIQRRDYDVTGVEQIPLLPAAAVLLLALGGLMLAWRREGR